MPQVDLETLVSACAGGSCDRKIACETLADDEEQRLNSQEEDAQQQKPPEIPPDFPPESFWLSKEAELDWFDRNAFIERKDSHKGNNSTNLNPNPSSTSQRFALKSKASIIGLPKPQKTNYVDCKNRKPGNIRLFPKRTGSTSKSGASVVEPGSPKVSCMGRVRSKRDRKKRSKDRQKKSVERERVKDTSSRRGGTGFLASFRAIFWHGKDKTARDADEPSIVESPKYSYDIRDRLPARERQNDSPSPRKSDTAAARRSADSETAAEPFGLGGMKRFASGRRSETWELVTGDVA